MDTMVSSEALPPSEVASVALSGDKRPVESGETGELEVGSTKRMKNATGEMQRVAEIVLVLSAMAGMRGGRSPTEAEVDLMKEAREKLAEICQDLAPRELVTRDAIGTVVEDLGLNLKAKDQRLGFRGSRLSIKEKFSIANKKMEEPRKFASPSATYASQTSQTNLGAVPENRGPSHAVRMFPPNNTPLTSVGLPASSPVGYIPASASTSVTYNPLTTDVRTSTVSTGLPSSHLGRDSSALAQRVEKTPFKLEGGSSGTSYVPQAQANYPLVNAPTWSIQPHSTSSVKSASENKIPNHNPIKVEGTADLGIPQAAPQASRDQNFKPFANQTAPANLTSMQQPVQGMKYVQPAPFFNNHNEIAKVLQKLLQPKLPEHPTWTPPSREYMNKALTCQMCKLTVNEVETVVICDACEKGFHLKCLETLNQKGIPRGEWHCMRCTALSNGKPLPPKYGRVMRSITPPKGPSNPTGTQSSSEKKVGNVVPKVNQEKITVNGTSNLQSPPGLTISGSYLESASDLNLHNARSSIGQDADKGTTAGASSNNSAKSLGSLSGSSVVSSSERSNEQTQVSESTTKEEKSVSELKVQNPAVSDKINNKCEDFKISDNRQVIIQAEISNSTEVPLKTCQDQSMVEESNGAIRNSDVTQTPNVKQSEQVAAQANSVGTYESHDGNGDHTGLSSDGSHNVEWIGSVLKVMDGKTFYEFCCVNGVMYKVEDHALFRSSHDRLIPSKLQAMWEDSKTGSKWVTINQCYFPSDLPKAVGCPCAPESNEVYESNHESSVMASLIQGPCEVLSPTKFMEKSERLSQLGTEANDGSQPVFLCKWFYDECKGSFQPILG